MKKNHRSQNPPRLSNSPRKNNTLFFVFVFAVAISVFWSPRIWRDQRVQPPPKFEQGTCQSTAAQRPHAAAYQQQQNFFRPSPEALGQDFTCFELPGAVIPLSLDPTPPEIFVTNFEDFGQVEDDELVYGEEEDDSQQCTICPCRCGNAHELQQLGEHLQLTADGLDSTYSCSIKSSKLPMQFKLDEWARSYLLSGHMNQAIRVLRYRVRRFSDKIWSHIILGFCYERVGSYEAALRTYVHAAVAFPDSDYPRDIICQLFLQDLLLNFPDNSRSSLSKFVNIAHETCGYPKELYEMLFESGNLAKTGTIDEFDVQLIYQDLQEMNGIHWYKERWLYAFDQWGNQALQQLKKSQIGLKHIEYLESLLSSHQEYDVLEALEFSDTDEGHPRVLRGFELTGIDGPQSDVSGGGVPTAVQDARPMEPGAKQLPPIPQPDPLPQVSTQTQPIHQPDPLVTISPIPCQNFGTLATGFVNGNEIEQTSLQIPNDLREDEREDESGDDENAAGDGQDSDSESLRRGDGSEEAIEDGSHRAVSDSPFGDIFEEDGTFRDFDSVGIVGSNPCESSSRMSFSGNYCSTDRITEKMVCLSFACGDGPKLHRFHLYNFASL